MKKFFAILVAHLQRYAGNASGNDAGSPPLFSPSPDGNIPPVPEISRSASTRETAPPASRSHRNRNEDRVSVGASSLRDSNTGSPNLDFITREELKRELDLLRRLIESRK